MRKLVIRCRKKTKDYAVFIFITEGKALAQLTVPEQVLKEKNPIKGYIDALPFEAVSAKKPVTKKLKIIDLEPGMKHVNITAWVLETPKPKLVLTRWGMEVYVSNVLIADETGTIRLSLWMDQINEVSVDNVIKIENASVASFGGKRQLQLGKIGKLNVIEGLVSC